MAKTTQLPGVVLTKLMGEYQLNPNKLAGEIKLSQSAVRQVSIGKTRVSASVAARLAKYFGTTPKYWLDLQNDFDLAEAANDKKLQADLKGITKAKKPAPGAKKAPAAAKKGGKAKTVKSAKSAKTAKPKAAKPKAAKPKTAKPKAAKPKAAKPKTAKPKAVKASKPAAPKAVVKPQPAPVVPSFPDRIF